MLRSIAFVTAGVLLSTSLASGQTSSPSPVRFHGAGLVPYTNEWRLSFAKPGQPAKEVGTVTDELSPLEVDGQKLMRRTQTTTYDNGQFSSRDENVFEQETMRPLSMDFWRGGEHANHRDFDGRFVAFHPKGARLTIVDYSEPVYDFYGGMYGLLLAGLPLGEGFSTTIPAVDEDDSTFRPVPVRVLRREQVVAGRRGEIDTWVVEAETTMGAMRFWMAAASPYIIRLEWDAPKGVTAVYAMI